MNSNTRYLILCWMIFSGIQINEAKRRKLKSHSSDSSDLFIQGAEGFGLKNFDLGFAGKAKGKSGKAVFGFNLNAYSGSIDSNSIDQIGENNIKIIGGKGRGKGKAKGGGFLVVVPPPAPTPDNGKFCSYD